MTISVVVSPNFCLHPSPNVVLSIHFDIHWILVKVSHVQLADAFIYRVREWLAAGQWDAFHGAVDLSDLAWGDLLDQRGVAQLGPGRVPEEMGNVRVWIVLLICRRHSSSSSSYQRKALSASRSSAPWMPLDNYRCSLLQLWCSRRSSGMESLCRDQLKYLKYGELPLRRQPQTTEKVLKTKHES